MEIKELDFRTKNGDYKFSFVNNHPAFDRIVALINNLPQLKKETATIKKNKHIVYTCILPFGYVVDHFINFAMFEGDYIVVYFHTDVKIK